MRTILITGASRGLGLASATYLYKQGWRIVAAMRSVESGLEKLRAATGAKHNDPRLIGITLDLTDVTSIAAAAKEIEERAGPPDVIVHNAGLAAAGSAEETPMSAWQQLFATNLFGPVALTQALLPGMRKRGRGRIIAISSQGGIRGMPGISAYSASKGALERWAESLAQEIAPFGLGVTILVTIYDGIHTTGRAFVDKAAAPPEKFARALAAAVEDDAPIQRRTVGPDAAGLYYMARLLPGSWVHKIIRMAMKLPAKNALRDSTC
jgi:NAD(P)-dependent dehydrogenase (short-subunit alcohol dehydrogenase family)